MDEDAMETIGFQLIKDLRKDIEELSKTEGNEKIIQSIEDEIDMLKGLKVPEIILKDETLVKPEIKETCICQQPDSPFHGKNTKINFTQSQWHLMGNMLIAEANLLVKKSRGKKQKVFVGISVPHCPWCKRKL